MPDTDMDTMELTDGGEPEPERSYLDDYDDDARLDADEDAAWRDVYR